MVAHLWNHVIPRRLGTVYGADGGVVVERDPDTVLSPDAAFVRADRLPPLAEQNRFLRLAPDLAVQVVSPSHSAKEMLDKVMTYLAAGTRLVWVVDPRRRLVTASFLHGAPRVYREGDELDGGDVLPGFRVMVADLFDEGPSGCSAPWVP